MRTSLWALAALALLGTSLHAKEEKKPAKAPEQPPKLTEDVSRDYKIGGKTFDDWLHDMDSKDPSVRENAIRTIILYGPRAKDAVPTFIKELKKPYLDISCKVNAAIALGLLPIKGEHVDEAVTMLKRLLNDEQAIVRMHAALALGQMGNEAKAAIPTLLSKMHDRSTWEIRKACALALGKVAVPKEAKKPPDTLVIRGLKAALLDTCQQVRIEAAQSLVLLGPPGSAEDKSSVIARLRQAADKPGEDKTVRIWCHVGVMRMTGKVEGKHLAFIRKMLDDPILGVRCQAARALGVMGPSAKEAVPDLVAALNDRDVIMIAWAATALGQIGKPANAAVPALEKVAKKYETEHPDLKAGAQAAIAAIKKPAPRARKD